jgi:predicted ribonuclease YlaK
MRIAMPKTIFLDTNVYLHYKLFDQIDWQEIVHGDAITIVIPPVIIRELNKNKEAHPQTRIRKRAAAVIKKLARLFEAASSVKRRYS